MARDDLVGYHGLEGEVYQQLFAKTMKWNLHVPRQTTFEHHMLSRGQETADGFVVWVRMIG